jgi:Domain of unknown function (DUF5063)
MQDAPFTHALQPLSCYTPGMESLHNQGSVMEYRTHFIPLVRSYVHLIETAATVSDYALLARCAILLPQLYAWGRVLPDPTLPNTDDDEPPPVLTVTQPLFDRFGPHAFYHVVFDPLIDEDVMITHIADDLADIYHDMKRPLMRYDRGADDAQQLAIWEWRFTLRGHSGAHIVNVMRPIHVLINDHLPADVPDAVIASM